MSSNKTQPFVIDPNGIRDWAWSDHQILSASLSELKAHYEEFRALKKPIVNILPPRRWGNEYSPEPSKFLVKFLPADNHCRQLVELTEWIPSLLFEFYDWCYEYEWTVRRRISGIENYNKEAEITRTKGMLRHPDKWTTKSRRATNKGKPKMVSARNRERLERKWQREVIRRVKAGEYVSLIHTHFILPLEILDWATKIQKESRAHWNKMWEREKEREKYTEMSKKELRKEEEKRNKGKA